MLAMTPAGRLRAQAPAPPAVQDSAPRHRQVVTAPGDSVHVVVAGSGTPVVLIPGMFGSVFGFRKLLPLLLEAGCRTVVVEPLGIGTSARPARSDYSLSAQADRIAAVMDSLGIPNALIIGHSIGGAIAFRLAVRHPAKVAGLLSIEGGPTERAATPALGRAMRLAPLIRVFGGMKLIRHQLKSRLKDASGDTTWVTDPVITGYTVGAAADLGATLRAYRSMSESKEPDLLAPRLRDIQAPVRMLIGDAPHDGGAPPEEQELLRRSIRNFTVDHVPGAGHYIFEERPDMVAAALQRLRASLPATTR